MFKRHFKLIALILLIFSGFTISAKAFPTNSGKSSDGKHASFSAASKHNPEYQLINNNAIPVQLINFQRHKTGHYIQGIYNRSSESISHIRYLDITCGGYSSELSLFRKLILFPFHVFW